MVGEEIPEQRLFPQFLSVFLRFRLKECCLPLLSMRRLLNEFLLWKEFIRLNSQPIVWLSEMEGGGEHWGYCLAFALWIFSIPFRYFFHCGRGSAGRSLITCLPFVFALRMHNLFCFVLFFLLICVCFVFYFLMNLKHMIVYLKYINFSITFFKINLYTIWKYLTKLKKHLELAVKNDDT